MERSFSVSGVSLWLLLFLTSCFENTTKKHEGIKEMEGIPDSVEMLSLIAGYKDAEGYSLIIKNDSSVDRAFKVTCVDGYPDIIDSLIKTNNHIYESKSGSRYLVNDSEVIMTYFQKVIHPSSNWQGQTPWYETVVLTYPRLDRKLK